MTNQQRTFFSSGVVIVVFALATYAVEYVIRAVLAYKFGASREHDLFLLAIAIPVWLAAVLLVSLNKGFIPLYTDAISTEQHDRGKSLLTSVMVSFSLVVAVAVALVYAVLFVFRQVIFPEFSVADQSLFFRLFALTAPYVLFIGVVSILTSFLQANRRFALSSLFQFLYRPVYLAIFLLLVPFLHIFAVASGFTISAFIVAGMLIVYLVRKHALAPIHSNIFQYPDLKRFFAFAIPLVGGALIYKSLDVVDQYMASFLVEGSVTHIAFARQLALVPVSLVGVVISTVLFPSLSSFASHHQSGKLQYTFWQGIRMNFYLLIPVLAFVIVGAGSLVALLFERGAFGADATAITSHALVYYVGFILGGSLGGLLSSMFYAVKDSRTVIIVGITGGMVNIILNVVFMRIFGVAGLALASSVAALLNVVLFFWFLRGKLSLSFTGQLVPWVRLVGLFALTIGVTVGLSSFLSEASHFTLLVMMGVIAMVSFVVFSIALHVSEFHTLYSSVLTFFHRDRSRES
jgi:putative peptidoglycan lipid II flippase